MLVNREVEVNHVRLAICPVRRRGLRPRSVLWNLVAMAVNYIVAWLTKSRQCARSDACYCFAGVTEELYVWVLKGIWEFIRPSDSVHPAVRRRLEQLTTIPSSSSEFVSPSREIRMASVAPHIRNRPNFSDVR